MDLALLEQTLQELGEPRYRTGQVWRWSARGAAGFHEMTDLPATPSSCLSIIDLIEIHG